MAPTRTRTLRSGSWIRCSRRLSMLPSPRRLATGLLVLFGCSSPPAGEQHEPHEQVGAVEPEVAKPAETKAKAAQAELPPLPDVVATVEGHEILRGEFDALYEPAAALILARRTDG